MWPHGTHQAIDLSIMPFISAPISLTTCLSYDTTRDFDNFSPLEYYEQYVGPRPTGYFTAGDPGSEATGGAAAALAAAAYLLKSDMPEWYSVSGRVGKREEGPRRHPFTCVVAHHVRLDRMPWSIPMLCARSHTLSSPPPPHPPVDHSEGHCPV